MGANFVKLSDELILNVNEIQMVRKHGAGGHVWLRYMMHSVTLTEAEYAGLVQLVDWGLQSEAHQEAGQQPARSDQSFADWAASLGMYVPARRAYESDLALVNVAGRMLRVTEDLETPGLIDASEQVADGQKVVITSMKRDDFAAWMLRQSQGTFCFYGHPMCFGKPSGSNGWGPMTDEERKHLQPGLYRIYWKSGGHSLASVGILHDGSMWYAPCNWTSSPEVKVVCDNDWSVVERVQRIELPEGD